MRHRPEEKSDGDGERDFFIGFVKFGADRGETQNYEEKIKRVQRPAQKARGQSGPMVVAGGGWLFLGQ